ncbi:MAG: hydrogenase expression/formation protein [Dehalococcoidia bacterium]|nr:hydrogenase expression/formation protein [Dehalococcoidia bacterium]
MQPGKLPLDLLSRLLGEIDVRDPRVVLGARAGEDAALIDFGDRYLVAKTDPITFATDLIGWYMVQVNANDIAVMGGTPRWLMTTLLLPDTTPEAEVEHIFTQVREACEARNITLIGGHTEITYDLPRPVAVGAMLGEAPKERAVLTSGARPGDSIVLTKAIAVEGTSILAREAADDLLERGVALDTVNRAKEFLFSPGISVVPEASIACDVVDVHAMHDPTEGGLSGGLVEMAAAANVGLLIDMEAVPVLPECREICDALGLDPLGLIASGALIAAVPPGEVEALTRALAREGIAAHEIGKVTQSTAGLKVRSGDSVRDLPTFPRDELARWFGG